MPLWQLYFKTDKWKFKFHHKWCVLPECVCLRLLVSKTCIFFNIGIPGIFTRINRHRGFLFNLGGFRPLPCPITMYTPLRLVNTILKGINRVICISTTRGHQFKLNLKQRCLLVMQVPSTHKRLCVVSNCTLTHSFDPRAQLDSRHFQLKQNHLFT